MLLEIKDSYNSYKEIYKKVLPEINGETSSELARALLENSLYLSVFTTFENFLKKVIDNYIYNKEKQGVMVIELSDRIAHAWFVQNEKQIVDIFSNKKDRNKAFDSFFKMLKSNVDKKTLETHIHFEFLHKDKLNGYYKNLFQEILGDGDFLDKLQLVQNVEDFGELNKQSATNATTFLSIYTGKIRNNIAHQNENFRIEEYSSFNQIVDTFYQIIQEIYTKYTNYTGFNLEDEVMNNMLDDY